MRISIQSGLLLFVGALALAAFQDQPPANKSKDDATKPKTTASLAGRVLNAQSNEPLKKATLLLVKTGGGSATPTTAETNEKGEFSFDNIDPGRYYLTGERTGFTRQAYGARGNSLSGTMLLFTAGQEVKDLTFKLLPNAVIAGKVLDEDGDPIANCAVMALRPMYQRGKKQFLPLAQSVTNDLGEYRLANLKAGRYFVSATQMNLGIGLAGASNKPPTDKAEPSYTTTYYPNSMEKDGAAPIDVGVGAETRGMDIRMAKIDTFRVKGKLAATPGKQVLVLLTPKGAGITGLVTRIHNMAIAQQDGTFEIKGVPPGSYTLSATSDGMSSLGPTQTVQVGDQHIAGLILQSSGNDELTGTVKVEGDDKADLKKMEVSIEPIEVFNPVPPKATAGEDGKFTLKDVAPDRYLVHGKSTGANEAYYLKAVRYNGVDVLEDGIDLNGGMVAALEVTLSANGAQVDGTIAGADGNPETGVTVVLIPDSRRFSLYKEMTTDQHGGFSFKGVTPGDYKVLAWEDIETGAYQDPEFLKPFLGRAEAVSVKESEHKTVSPKLIVAEKAK